MWRALSLRDANGNEVPQFGYTREEARKLYWAATFRSLGDVVHLVQDMAQPQHTRNETHAIARTAGFEEYIDARARRERSYEIDGLTLQAASGDLPDVPLGPYAIPRFSRYSDYWSTRPLSGSTQLWGLADYSNRGFFTFDNNVGKALPYAEPANVVLVEQLGSFGSFSGFSFKYLSGNVEDRVTGAVDNIALSTRGIFTGLVQPGSAALAIAPMHTLTKKNFDDYASLLLPRAVGYSAGVIDYFFRGQLYVAPPAEGVFGLVDHGDLASNCKDTCGFKKIKLRVANSTPDITPPSGTATPQGMTGGKVVAVAKFRRNSCYTTDLSGEYHGSGGDAEKIAYYNSCVASQPEEIVVSDAMNVSGIPACGGNCDAAAVPYTFNFQSPIPINAASLSLQLVYRGVLGSEADAVVVQTVDVSEPSYYVYMNASDYIKLGQSVHTPAEINADANLRALVRPTACIVNDQLSPTCFPPVELNFPLLWGDPAPTTTGLAAPVALAAPKQFSRLAMIAPPPGGSAVVNQSASPCLPNELSRFPGRETQERFVPVGTPPAYQPISAVSPMSTARAVYTTYAVACVVNGDGVLIGPDDRFTKMAPLVGAELTPKALVGFSFGN